MNLTKFKDVLSWILLGIGMLLVLWYIFGDSPTFEQALLVMITGYLVKISSKIGKMEGKLGEHLRGHK